MYVHKGNDVYVFMGHSVDVDTILDDIYMITKLRPEYTIKTSVEGGYCYEIRLPINLAKIHTMGVIKRGKSY